MQVSSQHVRGDAHPNSKLTYDKVAEMFVYRRLGWTNKKIAKEVGVNPSTVSRALSGVTWRDQHSGIEPPPLVDTLADYDSGDD